MGILLGLGAAIPLGPVNLEMIRRNLRFGTVSGCCFGLGACTADVIYLVLLSFGALTVLTQAAVLKAVGITGSVILAYFGMSALRMKIAAEHDPVEFSSVVSAWWRQTLSGLLMTLLNPFTILFWSSVSSQVVTLAGQQQHATLLAGSGVLLGTVGWVSSLNLILHLTRHRLSATVNNYLNKMGGIILLGFAGFGIIRVFW